MSSIEGNPYSEWPTGLELNDPNPAFGKPPISKIVDARRSVYGPPEINFKRIADLMKVIDDCKDPLARVALNGIAIKISRLIESPNHQDSWDDIAGYADCGKRVTSVRGNIRAEGKPLR